MLQLFGSKSTSFSPLEVNMYDTLYVIFLVINVYSVKKNPNVSALKLNIFLYLYTVYTELLYPRRLLKFIEV